MRPLRLLVGLLLFLALTVEYSDTFAGGKWHTVMAYALPLFEWKLPGVGLGPWDLALLSATLLAAVYPATWRRRVPALDLVLLVSLAAVLAWVLFGVLRGGDARQALSQTSALVRMFVLAFVVHAAFRKPRDVKLLALVVLLAALYRAAACLAFYFFFVRAGSIEPYPQSMTDHHDSTLWVTAVLCLVSLALATRRAKTLWLAALAILPLLLAIHYNTRRIAWVELAGGLALFLVAMRASRQRRRMLRRLAVIAPVALVYLAIGWGRPERIFAPVAQLRSALGDDANMSNDARDLENRGLIVTLQQRRLLGSGFGHEFTEVSVLYSLGMARVFPNYRYLPHNSLLGLLAFTGVVGFSLIWLFVPVSAFVAARAHQRAAVPLEQALSLTAFAVPFVYTAQAFGDMGLQSLKANVLLAVSTAVAARLAVATGAWPVAVRRRLGRVSYAAATLPEPVEAVDDAR